MQVLQANGRNKLWWLPVPPAYRLRTRPVSAPLPRRLGLAPGLDLSSRRLGHGVISPLA